MFKTLILSVGFVGFTATAQASVFDFDDFALQDTLVSQVTSSDGLVTANLSVVDNVNSQNDGSVNSALIFDTENGADGDPDLQSSFLSEDGSSTSDAGGVLVIAENDLSGGQLPDDNANGGSITFDFLKAIDFTGFAIYDDANITVTSNLGGVFSASVATDGRFDVFSVGATGFSGVTQLTFDFGRHSGAIDDLQVSLTAVPVPAALPLLLAGLGGLGVMSRRRRQDS